MSKFLSKGRAIVASISIVSVLAMSVMSAFTGISFTAFAEAGSTWGVYDDSYIKSYPKSDNASAVDLWDGTAAAAYADGSGASDDPYIVETAEQFYRMLTVDTEANAYYRVADGVTDFYFNDVEDMSAEQAKSFFEGSETKNTFTESKTFNGYIDANGVTVHGMYINGPASAGMLSNVETAVILNLNLDKCYAVAESNASLITGNVKAGSTVTIKNISITDSYSYSPKGNAALIAANLSGGCTVNMSNILIKGSAVKSDATDWLRESVFAVCRATADDGVTVNNAIVLGTYPASGRNLSGAGATVYNNVYTDTRAANDDIRNATATINVVENTDAFMSEAVKDTVSGFDWEKSWQITDTAPLPRVERAILGSVGKAWSGAIANIYAGGNGTETNPYKIDTPERLAKMLTTAKEGEYYILTADIIINDTTDSEWIKSAKKWCLSSDVQAFSANFNGNNRKITGLYNSDVADGSYAGLIPMLGSGAVIKNVVIDNSYISGKSGSYIGALAGGAQDNAAKAIVIRGCTVGENVELKGAEIKGGLVGRIGFAFVRADNCISKSNGFVGETAGKLNIKSGISINAYPFGSTTNVLATNIYTNTSGDTIDGVTVLDDDSMKGDKAEETMSALNFSVTWETKDNDYPALTGRFVSTNGAIGEIWTGDIATGYEGGDGSAENPYLIATGEQLARLVTSPQGGASYKLVADIYLNDVNSNLWESKVGCNEWFTATTAPAILSNGTVVDGDGHVVFGMYVDQSAATPTGDMIIGLIPRIEHGVVVKNIGLSQSYILGSYSETRSEFVGGIVGWVTNWDGGDHILTLNDTADGEYGGKAVPVISNCFVDHTCYISGKYVGGIIGGGNGAAFVDNCYSTATVYGVEKTHTAGIVGYAMEYGWRVTDCFSSPQTCDWPIGSSRPNQWSSNVYTDHSVYAENVYYFSKYKVYGGVEKLANPSYRTGAAAQENMPYLDWEGEDFNGTADLWRVVEDGTPVLTVFAKHRSGIELEQFSDKNFKAPEVKLSLQTGTTDIKIDPIVGSMYSPLELPELEREGYKFTGWYLYPDYSYEYTKGYFLPRDFNLYAGWEPIGVVQDFESYPNTQWDIDYDRCTYFRPGAKGGYNAKYTHGGSKSMHILNTSSEVADVLLNYEDMLTVGETYTISFWVTTDDASNPATVLSLVHNSLPDYLDTAVAVEPMTIVSKLQDGEWVKYSYTFTALTKWASIRVSGNSSIYLDDVIISPAQNGAKVNADNVIYLGSGTTGSGALSPNTNDSATTILVSTLVAAAAIMIIAKKSVTEIIED